MFGKTNHFDTKMATINQQVEAMKAIAAKRPLDFDSYRAARVQLNIPILEIIFGAEIDNTKIKFNKPTPTLGQIGALMKTFNQFYLEVETPVLEDYAKMQAAAAKDPQSPNMPTANNGIADIPVFEKIKVKDVKAAIVGQGQYAFPMISNLFTPMQILEMAKVSEDLRKKIKKDQILIIGGITLAVAAAAGVGVYAWNKHKDNDGGDIVAIEVGPDESDESGDDAPDVVDLDLV